MRLVPERGGVRIVVSDTGRGMSQDELARAFDDFHTTKPSGTGLGLSVVRRLASDMGATVQIASATG
jgi:signal transduction histidine kinase